MQIPGALPDVTCLPSSLPCFRRFGAGTPKTWVQDSGSPEGSGLRPVRAPLSPRSPGCPSSADSPELMEPSATPGAQTGVPSGSAEPSPLPPDYEDEFLRYLWRDYLYPKQYEWVLIAAYVAVFLVALVGNTLGRCLGPGGAGGGGGLPLGTGRGPGRHLSPPPPSPYLRPALAVWGRGLAGGRGSALASPHRRPSPQSAWQCGGTTT